MCTISLSIRLFPRWYVYGKAISFNLKELGLHSLTDLLKREKILNYKDHWF
jgi:hypothetical protein